VDIFLHSFSTLTARQIFAQYILEVNKMAMHRVQRSVVPNVVLQKR